MSDIPNDSGLSTAVVGTSSALIGGVIFIPDPAGFDALLRINGPVGSALKRWGEATQDLAKAYAPVDTGELRDSIEVVYGKTDDGIYADVGTDTYYGGYQELGTSRNEPHPYLRPALMAIMSQIEGGQVIGGYVDEVDISFSYDGEGDFADTQFTDTVTG